jgi:hypothetical protein
MKKSTIMDMKRWNMWRSLVLATVSNLPASSCEARVV